MGIFFSLMAVGLIGSRLFAGKLVDRGKLLKVIRVGSLVCLIGFLLLSSLKKVEFCSDQFMYGLFYLVAVVLGVGYGMIFPAYNTLFVNLAQNNRRATASSTYLTSWDLGVGIGLVMGGTLADTFGGLPLAFLVGALATGFSFLFFKRIAGPHFDRNKLR